MAARRMRSRRPAAAVLVLSALTLCRCATAPRQAAVPFALQSQANVVGFPSDIRYFPRDAAHVEDFEKEYLLTLEREEAYLRSQGRGDELPPSVFLAISGGGDNGASAQAS